MKPNCPFPPTIPLHFSPTSSDGTAPKSCIWWIRRFHWLSRRSLQILFWAPLASVLGADPEASGPPLLLRDFKPKLMMQLTVTRVERARFPVVDVHNHLNDASSVTRPHPAPSEIVARMDQCNVQRIVILT